MTDKQIIIDGVDVSGCDCYYDGKCLCEYNEINRKIIRYYSCNRFPNCYYKNWQRKEQECDELKKEINNKYSVSNFNVIFMREHIHNLKQTLTEIKEIAERGFKHSQCNCGAKADLDLILQKISEVGDE